MLHIYIYIYIYLYIYIISRLVVKETAPFEYEVGGNVYYSNHSVAMVCRWTSVSVAEN